MLLEAQSLTAGYGSLTVLHGIGIDAPAGTIVTVLGPNGAGKSTLMKTLAGHLKLTGGSIRLDGTAVSGLGAMERARAGIGYVPQEGNVFPGLSVFENLRIPSLSFPGAEERVDTVLERFPILAERSRQRASTLSGGERQTLAIASALIGAPKLLLLDEPTAGLAPLFVARIIEWVEALAASGMGVVWVIEQNPEAILAKSTTTTVIGAGRATAVLPSEELLDKKALEAVIFEMDD